MTLPTILHIKMTPAGLDLAIAALRKLPHDQVDPLVQELWAQYKQQMQQIAETALTVPDGTEDAQPVSEGGAAGAE